MKRLVRILAAAAVVAIAAPAAAHGCEETRQVPRPVPVHERWDATGSRHDGWRARELLELRREYRELEAEHAAFHARWAGRPGKLRKYDRGYAVERARLDARWNELTRPAYAAR
jgi:hypothetical protein